MGRKSKKEGMYLYVWLIILLYSRNQHNIVKQPFSKTINLKNLLASLLFSQSRELRPGQPLQTTGIHQGARLCPLCTCPSMVLSGNSVSPSFLTSKQGSELVQIPWRPSSPLGGWLCGDLEDELASVTCQRKTRVFGSLFPLIIKLQHARENCEPEY